MPIQKISREDFFTQLNAKKAPFHDNYLSMYSSWSGGITTDPLLMLIPVDDHIVHRGDGIFEALKVSYGKIYLLKEHLNRLYQSAEKVSLKIPVSRSELEDIVKQTVQSGQHKECGVRIYVSRGPGGFGPSPYESVSSQLYVAVVKTKPPEPIKYQNGVTVGVSQIPMKDNFQATVKSCNYLFNVLMKKEAVDKGWDFPINISKEGHIGEGATENIGFITQDNCFLVPSFHYTLKGTTLVRLMTLAESLVKSGKLKSIREDHISLSSALKCREAIMFGTTIGAMPVSQINGQKLGDGKPGPIFKELLRLHEEDLHNGILVL